MLLTLALILIILWLLGIISSYTLGGWIYLLLIVGVIMLVVRLIVGPPRPPPY
ncbi:MAG TPA: lmo0937 family membrane protein [Verrucomicrobiae bacterium]|nr:lmo0937 family membrane protein [Verrucomicrobiae bacterium]